jgi:transposase
VDSMDAEKSRKRRRYSRELKDQIIARCAALGASVAKVALSHGINANILHGWRKLAGRVPPAVSRPEFISVAVAPMAQATVDERTVELELRRGAGPLRLEPEASANRRSGLRPCQ